MVYKVLHRKLRLAGGRGRACCPASPPRPRLGSLCTYSKGQTLAFVPAGVSIRACRISDREIIPTILSVSFTTTSRWTCKQEERRPRVKVEISKGLKWTLEKVFRVLYNEQIPQMRERNSAQSHAMVLALLKCNADLLDYF